MRDPTGEDAKRALVETPGASDEDLQTKEPRPD
jgi:hypothetical protein